MAPELIWEHPFRGSYDDWSLACTIFELVTDTSLFTIPEEVSDQDWQNYLLQRIVQQIGKPTPEYLKSCKRAAEFFDEHMEFRQNLHLPQFQNWKIRILQAARVKNWSADQIQQLIELLSTLLCYQKRTTPKELLKHPLFNRDIVVHLLHDPQETGKLVIQRASTIAVSLKALALNQISTPDFTLRFHQPIQKCLHLPKDPQGEYIVILEKNDLVIKQKCFFRDSSTLDIRALQKNLAIKDSIGERTPCSKRHLDSSTDGSIVEGPKLKKHKKNEIQ